MSRSTSFVGVRARAKQAVGAALMAGAAGLTLAPSSAFAENDAGAVTEAAPSDGASVGELRVTGSRKGEPDSPKYTAPILDMPQTITVVSKEIIAAQDLMTLRDILSTVPGITFGAGEGGGGYGDSINLRGYAASSDITVDGVRDSAQYTRSDPFNMEQLEVTNGANGVYSGAGSVGGSINIVSKSPLGRDSRTLSLATGTDSYYRATLDANRPFGDSVAVRLNAMVHRNDAPGRDVENYRRWGVAPSLAIGLSGPTQLTLSYFHQHDDNIPQYGVPFALNNFNFGVLPGVSRERFYGFANVDTQQSDVDAVTARIEHRIGEALTIRNLTRRQVVGQLSIVDQPQGTFCLANGVLAAPASIAAVSCAPADTFTRNVSGTTRNSRNTNLYNQTDLTGGLVTGGLTHSIDFGFSAMSETYRLANGAALRAADGAAPAAALLTTSLSNPGTVYRGPVNFIQAGAQRGRRQNQAVYLFDTVELTPRWQVNGGLRYEHNLGENRTDTVNTTVGSPAFGTMTLGPTLRNSEALFSYRAGLVFKPAMNASLYLAYANARTPSQSAVNGACTAQTCNVDPEAAVNYELGGKWNVFDSRLSLTASIFRNERSNYKVASNDPAIADQTLDGHARVDGVILGAAGRITRRWSVFANYTHLDSKVVRGKSRFCVATPTAAGCPSADADPTGRELTNTPANAASLWTTIDLPHHVQIGYGLTYSGSYLLSNTLQPRDPVTNAARPLFRSQAYAVHRAMISYEISQAVDLRLNVNNLTNTAFLQRIRNSAQSWATPGDARNATLTLNYRF